MATEKLFNTVGISTLNGETKVRFANDASRVKVLQKNGHTDILLITLSEALTKMEAVLALSEVPEFQHPAAQEAINEFISKGATKQVAKPKAKVKAEGTEEVTDEAPAEVTEAPVRKVKVKDPAVRVRAKAKKLKEALPTFNEDEEVPF
jgi:anion-transporting  ArsA/GET3 family ATPase